MKAEKQNDKLEIQTKRNKNKGKLSEPESVRFLLLYQNEHLHFVLY